VNERPLDSLIDKTMIKIKEMVDVNTVVGKPIVVNADITVIPISKIVYGFATGGTEFSAKKENKENKENLFGGGSGAGVTVAPVAFLVINKGDVKVVNVETSVTTVEKTIDALPDILEKVKSIFKKKGSKKEKVEIDLE